MLPINLTKTAVRAFSFAALFIFPFTDSLAGSCKVCADPSLANCKYVAEGATLVLSTVGLKDQVSSIQLSPGQSLQYWTWNQDSSGDRGIIYRTASGYESTNNSNLNPEYWLNTNDDFDVVRCDNFSRWEAILYKDPDLAGGRYYVKPNEGLQSLAPVNLVNQISSIQLRAGTRLKFKYNGVFATYDGWIQKNYNQPWSSSPLYSSSAGGADNTPEHWLATNDSLAEVEASITMPVYIQRHGETTNGSTITPAGQTALQTAWNSADCRLISNSTTIYHLYNAADPASQRYTDTAQIVKQTLETHCLNTTVSLAPLSVTNLVTVSPSEATVIMNKIKEQNDSTTRIFILGSTLLHDFTDTTACGSAPCYLTQWTTFMALWNAGHALQDCQIPFVSGSDYDTYERRHMYNYVYRVQRFFVGGGTQDPICMSSIRIPLDNYTKTTCTTEEFNYNTANNCPTP